MFLNKQQSAGKMCLMTKEDITSRVSGTKTNCICYPGLPGRDFFYLNGETFTASAGTACVRVVEVKTFSVQTFREFQSSIHQIKEAFQVGNHFHAIILKNLVSWFQLIVKIHFIAETGAATSNYAYAQKM